MAAHKHRREEAHHVHAVPGGTNDAVATHHHPDKDYARTIVTTSQSVRRW